MEEIKKFIDTNDLQRVKEMLIEKNDLIIEDKRLLGLLGNSGTFSLLELKAGTSPGDMWDVLFYATDVEKQQIINIVKDIVSRQIDKQTLISSAFSKHIKNSENK